MTPQTTILKMRRDVALCALNLTNPKDSRYWLNELRLIEQELRILNNAELFPITTVQLSDAYEMPVFSATEWRKERYRRDYRVQYFKWTGTLVNTKFELTILN